MRITIKVLPRSSKNKVIPLGDDSFKVKLTVAPVAGKANGAMIKLLAVYFAVAKSNIKILKGEKGKNKVVEIDTGARK